MVLGEDGYTTTATAHPALVHDDIVIALAPEKKINNGQPSLHARCLSAARIQPGERVLHIGCGAGYYSAILSELVTSSGSVTGWDVEPRLVEMARSNLGRWPNVSVALRNGTEPPIPESDVIYVCAGCTQPPRSWVAALSEGGRLLFPLTPGWDFGSMLVITRQADRYSARFICRCSFVPCVGASTLEQEKAVRAAFSARALENVSELRFGDGAGESSACLVGDGWWLSEAAVH